MNDLADRERDRVHPKKRHRPIASGLVSPRLASGLGFACLSVSLVLAWGVSSEVLAIVLAYVVRFFAIAQGAADGALGRISPSLPMAARSLGRSAGGTLRDVHLPMISGSVATALLLVFVDAVKELPATLLLRPFNFDTLATRVYNQASLERIGDAAPPAMLVILVGLAAVLVLARSNR